MDIASIIGLIATIGFTIFGILNSGSIWTFYDLSSIYITVGGTIGGIILSSRVKNLKNIPKLLKIVFTEVKSNDTEIIDSLVEWSTKARREGLLSLEESLESIADPFIRKGMTMIVDGAEPDNIRNILEIKIEGMVERHKQNTNILDTGAALAPAFGMLGTLIGLVNMLKKLNDPSAIGPQMGVALITTFYGSVLANIFFMPMSRKLKAKTASEVFQKQMIIEGLLGIQAGENPNNLRDKMLSFLDEKAITKYEDLHEKEN